MRYFLAFYSININGSISLFDMSFSTEGAPVRRNVVEAIREYKKDIPETATIVFTNFTEISKEDFENWGK